MGKNAGQMDLADTFAHTDSDAVGHTDPDAVIHTYPDAVIHTYPGAFIHTDPDAFDHTDPDIFVHRGPDAVDCTDPNAVGHTSRNRIANLDRESQSERNSVSVRDANRFGQHRRHAGAFSHANSVAHCASGGVIRGEAAARAHRYYVNLMSTEAARFSSTSIPTACSLRSNTIEIVSPPVFRFSILIQSSHSGIVGDITLIWC
jgi:hypothetical protein